MASRSAGNTKEHETPGKRGEMDMSANGSTRREFSPFDHLRHGLAPRARAATLLMSATCTLRGIIWTVLGYAPNTSSTLTKSYVPFKWPR